MPSAHTGTGPVRSELAEDPDFRELLELFGAALPERRTGLVEAHRQGAYSELRTRAHQLKGAGGGFGFPKLSELAAALEQACIAGDPARIAESLEQIVGYMNRITI